jgi:predicted alpha/beta-fold hydrolase
LSDSGEYRSRPFRPPWWLRGPHAQSLGGKFLRPDVQVPWQRHRLETEDDDFIDVDIGTEPGTGSAPVVIVLHGLGGGAHRRYVKLTGVALLRETIRPVAFNFRSCSGEMNRRARSYHSGETGDLARVLAHLTDAFPGVPVGAVGFSLGGNVLLKYLAERGPESAIDAAVAVSVPFDLSRSADALERGIMGRLYSHYLLRSLLDTTRRKANLIRPHLDVEHALGARTIREFDERLTAPLFGFRGAEDYYSQASSGPRIGEIRVPTLLIQSRDDPFAPGALIPERRIEDNPCVVAAVEERGGHVGFLSGMWPWNLEFWAESEAARFLARHLTASRPVDTIRQGRVAERDHMDSTREPCT